MTRNPTPALLMMMALWLPPSVSQTAELPSATPSDVGISAERFTQVLEGYPGLVRLLVCDSEIDVDRCDQRLVSRVADIREGLRDNPIIISIRAQVFERGVQVLIGRATDPCLDRTCLAFGLVAFVSNPFTPLTPSRTTVFRTRTDSHVVDPTASDVAVIMSP